MALLGVDVSVFQGGIDFSQLATQGKYAIIREGYGNALDARFTQDRDAARANKVPRGFYHYAYPTLNTGAAEARSHVANVGGFQVGESTWLDMEQDYSVSWALNYLQTLEGLCGFKPGIYLNLDAVRSFDWSPVVAGGYGLWLADWDQTLAIPSVPHWGLVAMKQFYDRGLVAGIRGYVDTDVFNGTLAQFFKYGKPSTAPGPTPTPKPAPTPAPPAPAPAFTWYTVVGGDTESSIAARFHVDLGYFESINRDIAPDPNKISVGERLRVPGHSSPTPTPPAPAMAFVTVAPGDTLTAIAARHGMNLSHLLAFPQNAVYRPNPNRIFPGQHVRVA